jgi:glucosamine--fructose-6-phosphate aminotransferase (isomerizing)
MSDAYQTGTHLYRAIHEQPAAIRNLLAEHAGIEHAANLLLKARRILLSGIGTSYHAACVGAYLLRYAGADALAMRSFELVHYPPPISSEDVLIIISHRGSKFYGAQAIERAIISGIPTIGITGKNTKMQGVNLMLETVEQDPSSTHSISYTGALTCIAQIAVQLAALKGEPSRSQNLAQNLARIPALMDKILAREDDVRQVAQEAVQQQRRLYFIGAGPNAATAPEGALKAKEAAYVTAEGFELEQAMHGPLVAFESSDLLIPIAVTGNAQARISDLLLAAREIGIRTWLVGDVPEQIASEQRAWSHFPITDGNPLLEELTPLLTVLPLQLLANFLAAARGTNADSFRQDEDAYQRASARFRI